MASALARSSKPSSMPEAEAEVEAAGEGLEIGEGLVAATAVIEPESMPPLQIGAELDVGDQLAVHRLPEQAVELLAIFLVVGRLVGLAEVEIPILRPLQLGVGAARGRASA